jgi:uncharacterized protein (TIGR04206 family)
MKTSSSSSSESEESDRRSEHWTDQLRPSGSSLFGVLALWVVPWTVIPYPSGVTLIFPWASATTNPLHVTSLWAFIARNPGGIEQLPPRLFAWPLATVLLVGAVLGALAGRFGHEDRRLTAGMLVLAGVVHLRVTIGLAGIGETAVPIGSLLAFGVAWWHYAGSATEH